MDSDSIGSYGRAFIPKYCCSQSPTHHELHLVE